MLEKIKDIIYDISDYLLTIIIIFFIVISIAFVMTKSYGLEFSKNDLLSLFNKEEEYVTPELLPEDDQLPEVLSEEPEVPETKPEPEEPIEETEEEEEEAQEYVLSIEAGDNSNSIASRLEDAGIVKDRIEFVNALVDKGLDTAIQIGEFTFQKNMSLEEVIDILFP